MSPKNVRQQCDDKSFFSMVIKEEYSADRMKSRVVRSIAIFFPFWPLPKNCALLHMNAILHIAYGRWVMFLNLLNILFKDLESSFPISLTLSDVSGEVKQRTNCDLTSVEVKNESAIRLSGNISLLN